MSKWKQIGLLFLVGLRLGSTVFGGAAAAYPVIRRLAAERRWLTESEVDGLFALSVLLPGPSFLNLWGAVAHRLAGLPGALAAQVGVMLPAALAVTLLPLATQLPILAGRTEGALHGAVWATTGLLAAAGAEGIVKGRLRERVMTGAVLALLLLGAHPVWLLAGALLLGGAGALGPVTSGGSVPVGRPGETRP